MAFSTKREYNTSHAMTPTVQASRGAGSAASSSASIPVASGNKSNDLAALGGMGAVGAGLLGKFAYDKSKQDLMEQAANEGNDLYNASSSTAFTEGPNADVMGALASKSGGVTYEAGQPGLSQFSGDGTSSASTNPGFIDTAAHIPSTIGKLWGAYMPTWLGGD